MKLIAQRGLKIFFRDKGGVFFSLLGVVIIFCLYIFFIGDSIVEGMDGINHAKEIMNNWVLAGMLASASITTSMGAYAIMVTDKEQKINKDFNAAPIKTSKIVAGYMITGYIISVIMTLVTFIMGEIYVVVNGGSAADVVSVLKILGVILISSFAASALVCFIISFVKTINAYTTISIILGTLIGFLVGAYVTIGSLPNGVQNVIRFFPCAHAAALFRKILMNDSMSSGFEGLGGTYLVDFQESVGVIFKYGDHIADTWIHIIVLIGTGVVFYMLAILNMSRKK